MRASLGGRDEGERAKRALQVAQAGGGGRDLSPSAASSVRFVSSSSPQANRNGNRKQQAHEIHLVRAAPAQTSDCDLEPSSLESAHGRQAGWGRHSAGRASKRHSDTSFVAPFEIGRAEEEEDSLSSSPSLGLAGFVYRVSSDESERSRASSGSGRAKQQQQASTSGHSTPTSSSSSSSKSDTRRATSYAKLAPALPRLRSWSPLARKLVRAPRRLCVTSIAGSEPALNSLLGRRPNSASPSCLAAAKAHRKRASRRRRPESSQAALWPASSVSSSSVFALYASRYAKEKLLLALRVFKSWYHEQLTYHHLSSRMEFNRHLFERWYSSKGRPLSLRALDPYDQIVIWIAGKSLGTLSLWHACPTRRRASSNLSPRQALCFMV